MAGSPLPSDMAQPSLALELSTVRPAGDVSGLAWDSCSQQQDAPEMPAVTGHFIFKCFPQHHAWREVLLLRDFPGGCPEQDPGDQGHLKSTSTIPELGFWGRGVETVPWGLQLQVNGTPLE